MHYPQASRLARTHFAPTVGSASVAARDGSWGSLQGPFLRSAFYGALCFRAVCAEQTDRPAGINRDTQARNRR